jgi:hypothetical protein
VSVKTCIIAEHDIACQQLRRELAIGPAGASLVHANPYFHVLTPGEMPCAVMYDEVIIFESVDEKIATCPRHEDWFETCIRTRMTRDAQIVIVK